MPDPILISAASSERQFRNQSATAAALAYLSAKRGMTVPETLDALLCSLASVVQARAQPGEWAEVGRSLAEDIQRRLTVTGDTGDHHARRMV